MNIADDEDIHGVTSLAFMHMQALAYSSSDECCVLGTLHTESLGYVIEERLVLGLLLKT
ncbi:MAG: hypothetical protein QXG05_08620 [Nitrososphaerota archaeon]